MIIFFIGDSLTLGVGDPAYRGWPSRVLEMAAGRGLAPFAAYNLGVRADNTARVLARLSHELDARIPEPMADNQHPRFVLNIAPADAAQNQPQEQTLANALAIIEICKTRGPVLQVGPPPMLREPDMARRIAALNPRLAELAASLDVPYLDVYTPLANDSDYAAALGENDHIHPSPRGYAAIARLIDAWPAWRAWSPAAA